MRLEVGGREWSRTTHDIEGITKKAPTTLGGLAGLRGARWIPHEGPQDGSGTESNCSGRRLNLIGLFWSEKWLQGTAKQQRQQRQKQQQQQQQQWADLFRVECGRCFRFAMGTNWKEGKRGTIINKSCRFQAGKSLSLSRLIVVVAALLR